MSKERPTQEQREAIATDIRNDGAAALEVELEEMGLAEPTILNEADAEEAEGGGPIATAVVELEARVESEADAD